MPLYEKARIEAYLPDLPNRAYQELLEALDRELTYTFGGSTIIRGLDGSFLSRGGRIIRDRINLIYTDAPFAFGDHVNVLASYTDELREAASEALEEEAILVTVSTVHHSD